MEIEPISDKNNFKFQFQLYNLSEIETLTFPKRELTYTVAFFDDKKSLLAITIVSSLFDFVHSIRFSIDNLTKKGVKYFGFHYQAAAGEHFIKAESLDRFETSFTISYDREKTVVELIKS